MAAPRRIRSALLVGLLAFTVTCEGLDNIDVPTEGTTTIPAGTIIDELLGDLSFAGFEGFDISQSQEFRNAGYSKDQIDSVRLKTFVLEIDSPSDGNFDFLERVSFSAEADGLPAVEIARLDPIPDGQSRLELEILDVELQEYAVSETMTITTTATGVRPSEETVVNARAVLDVDVNVDGSLGCRVARVRQPARGKVAGLIARAYRRAVGK